MSEQNTPRRDPLFGTSHNLKEIVELTMSEVITDPNQPRQAFNEERLQELAQSINERGLLQPITVRLNPSGEGYIVVAGERRYRAHHLLGRERIEAIIIKDIDEKSAYELALIENLQREDLSPFEEAAGYQRLMDDYGYTQEEVADRVGKARPTVTKTLSLNRLPERIRTEHASQNRISKSLLLEIASLDGEQEQLALWEKIKRGATVRAARQAKQEKVAKPERQKPAEMKRKLSETVKIGQDFAKRTRKHCRAAQPSPGRRTRISRG
jgi:ParB family chromosome partitioning protein